MSPEMKPINELDLEGSILRCLLLVIVANGYSVTLNDGEEDVIEKSTNIEEIEDAARSTDEDYLIVFVASGRKVGAIRLIWGNGEDLISDYTDNAVINSLISLGLEKWEKLS